MSAEDKEDATVSATRSAPSPRWWNVAAWGGLALALVLQYALFREHALREVTWAYPFAHDQTYYLLTAYDTYEHILNFGLDNGVRYGLAHQGPTGMLLHLEAALLFLLLGVGRLTALTVNFLHFAGLQVAVFGTARSLSGRWTVAAIAWGLLLCATAPFTRAGGMMDFRIDFPALCAFGVFTCLALRSGLFQSRRWSLAAGGAAAYLVALRFLTVVYLTGAAFMVASFLLLRLWARRADAQGRAAEKHRLVNLALAGALAAAVALPALWSHRKILKDYYVGGHITGQETKIRLLMDGHELVYYPRSLLREHTGPTFVRMAALIAVAGLVLRWRAGTANGDRGRRLVPLLGAVGGYFALRAINQPEFPGTVLWWTGAAATVLPVLLLAWRNRGGDAALQPGLTLTFLLAMIGVPLAALTLDLHRSEVVGGIMLVPFLWLVLAPLLLGTASGPARTTRLGETALVAVAVVALASGGFVQASKYGQHWIMTRRRADHEQLLALHDRVAQTVIAYDLPCFSFAVTSNTDYLPHRISAVLMYERHGVLRKCQGHLGQFYSYTDERVLEELGWSDFVILSRPDTPVIPWEEHMKALGPKLRTWCQQHYVALGSYPIFGENVELYTRALRTRGGESGWITADDGLNVDAPGRVLRGATLTLGAGSTGYLERPPTVRAVLAQPGRSPRSLAAKVTFKNGAYSLRVHVPATELPAEERAQVRFSFDDYFVPAERGIGPDQRRLVVPAPERTELSYDELGEPGR